MRTLGQRLKEARKNKKLTQKQLADKIGAKHNSVSNWENDQNKPDPDTIELICGVLDIEPNYLLSKDMRTSSPTVNHSEEELLHKYRSLDDKGKHTVDTILEMEYNRCNAECAEVATIKPEENKPHLLPVAAHNDTITEPGELEKTMRDLAKLKRPGK